MIILSKSERERQIPYDIIYMWNIKYDTNEPKIWPKWTYLWNRSRLTDTENRLVVAKAGGGGVGEGRIGSLGLVDVNHYIQNG